MKRQLKTSTCLPIQADIRGEEEERRRGGEEERRR
jgi:hypothetical protein